MHLKQQFSQPRTRFLLFILFIVVLVFLTGQWHIDSQKIDTFLKQIPWGYACVFFFLLYVASSFIVWDLKDILKIIGAIFFGAYVSAALIYIAEVVNAVILFNVSSVFGKAFVEKTVKGRFKNFYEKLKDVSFGWLFLLRLAPLVAYRVLDISFGLTKISFRKYMFVVVAGSLPRIVWIQFILSAVKGISMEKLVDYFLQHPGIFLWSFLYLVFAVVAVIMLKNRFR